MRDEKIGGKDGVLCSYFGRYVLGAPISLVTGLFRGASGEILVQEPCRG